MTASKLDEQVKAAQDNEGMKSHVICPLCHPGDFPYPIGTQAICGERVLGIPAKLNSDKCSKCQDYHVRHKHFVRMHINGT